MHRSPPLADAHLLRMTDDTGIYQHALYDVPHPQHGYTTDDNARLMLVGAWGWEATGEKKYLDLCYRGLQFLLAAEKDGWFRNFMAWDRRFLEEKGSQDCFGRCIWCLGAVSTNASLPQNLRHTAQALLERALPQTDSLTAFHSRAYAVMGLAHLSPEAHKSRIQNLLLPLHTAFENNQRTGWPWFEELLTYCSAAMPHAFLLAGERLERPAYRQTGLHSLDFLLEHTIQNHVFTPIGNDGWFPRGGKPALYDQQPVEACCTLLACLTAHRLTGDERYMQAAESCHAWFAGKNTLGTVMIDPVSGGCYDGLQPQGANKNQGSESILSWFGASLALCLHQKRAKEEPAYATCNQ